MREQGKMAKVPPLVPKQQWLDHWAQHQGGKRLRERDWQQETQVAPFSTGIVTRS